MIILLLLRQIHRLILRLIQAIQLYKDENKVTKVEIPDYINKSSNHKYVSSSVSESTIKIFPNPAKEKVNVSFNTGNKEEKAKQIQIFDARGTVKFVKELKSSSGELEIPIDEWLQGVYIVIVHTNGKALQGKLIKK